MAKQKCVKHPHLPFQLKTIILQVPMLTNQWSYALAFIEIDYARFEAFFRIFDILL